MKVNSGLFITLFIHYMDVLCSHVWEHGTVSHTTSLKDRDKTGWLCPLPEPSSITNETEVSIHILILEYRGNAYHSTLGLHYRVEVIIRRYFLTLTHRTTFYPRSLCSEGGLHLGTFLPFLDRALSVQSTRSLTDAKVIFKKIWWNKEN